MHHLQLISNFAFLLDSVLEIIDVICMFDVLKLFIITWNIHVKNIIMFSRLCLSILNSHTTQAE